jgi:hypothetical protein
MKISRLGVSFYDEQNGKFNLNGAGLVDEMLQTQSEDPVGYVVSAGMQDRRPGLHLHVDRAHLVERETAPLQHSLMRYDLSGLGDYERVFLTALAWGRYSTYVVVGEMGSGKTAALKYVLARLREPLSSSCVRCQKIRPSIISINYNKGTRTRNVDAVLVQFRRRLRDQLRSNLKKLLAASDVLGDVMRYLGSEHQDEILVSLDDFVETVLVSDEWRNSTTKQRSTLLITWLNENCEDVSQHIECLMALIGVVHKIRDGHGGPFLLIFDNIDSVLPEAQYDLLLDVLAYQEIANVKAVVVLRQSTFAGLRSQRSYSFGVIRHCGPKPSQVLRKRIEHYSSNWASENLLARQSEQVRKAILDRCAFILREMDGRGGIAEFLDALCGDSVRLGLYAGIRLFVNNQVRWDRSPTHRNDALRGLLYGVHSEMPQRDNTVANIFVDAQGRFCLINVRILQLARALDDFPHLRTCANLRAILKAIGGWNGVQVCSAMNQLMMIRRPLIWADACAGFENPRDMEGDLVINLTNAGARYLTGLTRKLEYVQECLVSCSWPEGSGVPEVVQYSAMEVRFEVLRRCLSVMIDEDAVQVAKYLHFAPNRMDASIEPRLIGCDILFAMAESVRAIMLASAQAGDTFARAQVDPAKNWLSTIVEAYNKMDTLNITAGRENLAAVMRAYQDNLGMP